MGELNHILDKHLKAGRAKSVAALEKPSTSVAKSTDFSTDMDGFSNAKSTDFSTGFPPRD